VDISFTVCLFVILSFCVVTDFSKASSVKFCTVVHRCPVQGSFILGNFAAPEAQHRMNRQACRARPTRCKH